MNSNGHEYVDLGLPSGTMWATCNVGADKPEEDGLLFQFGRTDGYKYGDENNKFSTTYENKNMTGYEGINQTTSGTTYKERDILKLEDDAAHVNMGGKWIMPTKADLQELYDNTKQEVVTINGKKGMLFTSNINGKSIFIVLCGYWGYYGGRFHESNSCGYLRSSEVKSSDAEYSSILCCESSGFREIRNFIRANGYSVRAVIKDNETNDKEISKEINLDYLL